MARRPAARRPKPTRSPKKRKPARRSAKRPSRKPRPGRKAVARKKSPPKRRSAPAKKRAPKKKTAARRAGPRSTTQPFGPPPKQNAGIRQKASRIDRERRRLEETVQTPPSSLDMNRRGTAARTGRSELAESRREHTGMSASITGGDVDVDLEDAYFTGDEAPGGDNPTPDQEVVDDIGKALGVEYQDNEELKASDKVTERDKHRWELDPASSEDYPERKK